MFKNYLKINIRNLLRHKSSSLINILGLAVGMACCILILLWVADELSYDRFHANADHIFRVIQDIQFTDNQTKWAITQGALGKSLKSDVPEIVNVTRIFELGRFWQPLIKQNENQFYENALFAADSSLFEMFSFHLIRGNPRTVLNDRHSIVITEKMAAKYFGAADPMGKTLRLNNQYDFQVSGVLQNIPHNSSLQFDFLVPYEFGKELGFEIEQWDNSQIVTFIQVQPGILHDQIADKISNYLHDKPTLEKGTRLMLQPLRRIHLYSAFEFDRFGVGDYRYVTIFAVAALVILLIACINYTNLSTARYMVRAKDISIRKVVGASKGDIRKQFLGESLITAMMACVGAAVLVIAFLPAFNRLSAKALVFDVMQPVVPGGLIGMAIITGLISGGYPAVFLSSLRPLQLFKGMPSTGSPKSSFRKTLIILQFASSIILIMGTLIVYKQINFMRHNNLGYEKSQLITIRMPVEFAQKYTAFKHELLQNPGILYVTATSDVTTRGFQFSNDQWDWDGKNPDDKILIRGVFVDYDFFETFEMQMAEGRTFSPDFPTDISDAIIANETTIRTIGMEHPIGKRLGGRDYMPHIIGVVKDYHFRSLHTHIEPLALMFFGIDACEYVCIRIESGNIAQSLQTIERTWKDFCPDYPCEYQFLDEALDALYRAEERIGNILTYFSGLAIFISCLGLWGLSAFLAQRRTKEIGIRKTVGASVAAIVMLLSKDYLKWVLLAAVTAWPVAYLLMVRWLQNFAYRTDVTVWPFIISGTLTLMIALLTVSHQSIRAALANPVESLRYE